MRISSFPLMKVMTMMTALMLATPQGCSSFLLNHGMATVVPGFQKQSMFLKTTPTTKSFSLFMIRRRNRRNGRRDFDDEDNAKGFDGWAQRRRLRRLLREQQRLSNRNQNYNLNFSRDTKSNMVPTPTFRLRTPQSLQEYLLTLNLILFAVQIWSAFSTASFSGDVVTQTYLFGSTPRPYYGPFTKDFWHQSYWTLARKQWHRLLTAGFLHSNALHLFFNMRCLSQLPFWLEYGIGKSLYLSTYLAAIVGGNVAHSSYYGGRPCLGASGGLCGMLGLAFASLYQFQRYPQAHALLKQMLFVVLYGLYDPRVSQAGHVGGFLTGCLMGYIFGPRVRKSYVAKKGGVQFVDESRPVLRRIMGPNVVQVRSRVPLWMGWVVLVVWGMSNPVVRSMPGLVWRGVKYPGSLSGGGLMW